MALQYLLPLGMSYPTWHLKLQVTQSRGHFYKERVLLPGQLRLESLPCELAVASGPSKETVVWHSLHKDVAEVPAVGSSKGHSKAPVCLSVHVSIHPRSLWEFCTRADSNSSGGLPFGTGLWIMNLAVQVTLETQSLCGCHF